jgi:hypothetical protein
VFPGTNFEITSKFNFFRPQTGDSQGLRPCKIRVPDLDFLRGRLSEASRVIESVIAILYRRHLRMRQVPGFDPLTGPENKLEGREEAGGR